MMEGRRKRKTDEGRGLIEVKRTNGGKKRKKEAKNSYVQERTRDWLLKYFEVDPTGVVEIVKSDIYGLYAEWAVRKGFEPAKNAIFGKWIHDVFKENIKDVRKGPRGKAKHHYKFIRPKGFIVQTLPGTILTLVRAPQLSDLAPLSSAKTKKRKMEDEWVIYDAKSFSPSTPTSPGSSTMRCSSSSLPSSPMSSPPSRSTIGAKRSYADILPKIIPAQPYAASQVNPTKKFPNNSNLQSSTQSSTKKRKRYLSGPIESLVPTLPSRSSFYPRQAPPTADFELDKIEMVHSAQGPALVPSSIWESDAITLPTSSKRNRMVTAMLAGNPNHLLSLCLEIADKELAKQGDEKKVSKEEVRREVAVQAGGGDDIESFLNLSQEKQEEEQEEEEEEDEALGCLTVVQTRKNNRTSAGPTLLPIYDLAPSLDGSYLSHDTPEKGLSTWENGSIIDYEFAHQTPDFYSGDPQKIYLLYLKDLKEALRKYDIHCSELIVMDFWSAQRPYYSWYQSKDFYTVVLSAEEDLLRSLMPMDYASALESRRLLTTLFSFTNQLPSWLRGVLPSYLEDFVHAVSDLYNKFAQDTFALLTRVQEHEPPLAFSQSRGMATSVQTPPWSHREPRVEDS